MGPERERESERLGKGKTVDRGQHVLAYSLLLLLLLLGLFAMGSAFASCSCPSPTLSLSDFLCIDAGHDIDM